MVVDNTDLQLPVSQTSPITYLNLYGINVKCFMFDIKTNELLNLPMLAAHKDNPCFKDVMWANADYRFMYIRKIFPDYDYYWSFDYDIFCNGKSYKPFLRKYNKRKDALVICSFRQESHDSAWCWVKGIDWLYKNQQLYGSFFPVCRLSGKAIDFLYRKRLLYAGEYNQIPENRWPFSELFVPTELMNNGFSCSSIWANTIHLKNYNLNEDRIFEYPDNKLYHPVKSSNIPVILYNDSIKKYNVLQKIFSVSNFYKNYKKYKRIYFLFFKINFTCNKYFL